MLIGPRFRALFFPLSKLLIIRASISSSNFKPHRFFNLIHLRQTGVVKTTTHSYHRHRFPSEVISHAVWLYQRFCLSFREIEELLAKRGVTVTYETIRQWCQKFEPDYARKFKKRQDRLGDTWPYGQKTQNPLLKYRKTQLPNFGKQV